MSNELTTLSALAAEINLLDEQANHHAGQAVIYAARCGEKLLLAKAQCRHGQFMDWLSANCRLKERQAQKYMKLAKEYPEYLCSNPHSGAVLPGINQAIELLTSSDEIKQEVQERIDAGEVVTVKEIQELKRKLAEAEAKANDSRYAEASARDLVAQAKNDLKKKEAQIAQLQVQTGDLISEATENAKAKERLAVQHEMTEKESQIKALAEQIDKMKRDMKASVQNNVKAEMHKLDYQIECKQREIMSYDKDIRKLKETTKQLDKEIGALKIHQDYVKEIKESLMEIKVAIEFSRDTGVLPDQFYHDWEKIFYAVGEIRSQLDDWLHEKGPVLSLVATRNA